MLPSCIHAAMGESAGILCASQSQACTGCVQHQRPSVSPIRTTCPGIRPHLCAAARGEEAGVLPVPQHQAAAPGGALPQAPHRAGRPRGEEAVLTPLQFAFCSSRTATPPTTSCRTTYGGVCNLPCRHKNQRGTAATTILRQATRIIGLGHCIVPSCEKVLAIVRSKKFWPMMLQRAHVCPRGFEFDRGCVKNAVTFRTLSIGCTL